MSSVELPMNQDANGLPPIEAMAMSVRGTRLFTCIHDVPDPQGVVLLTHGLGEHSGRYKHVIRSFQEKGLGVLRFDLRGHGRSEGRRGHVDRYQDLMDDVSLMMELTREHFGDRPLVLFGHSLGGSILTNWCLRRPDETSGVEGIVISSPWFLLSDQPSALKERFIRALAALWPTFPIPARFRTRNLTRNKEAAEQYENDPLVHHQITTRFALEAYDAGLWALRQAGNFRWPALGVHGAADPITNPEGTMKFCAAAPRADLLLFNDLVHEPHNEPEWRDVVFQIRDWIVRRVMAAEGRPGVSKIPGAFPRISAPR